MRALPPDLVPRLAGAAEGLRLLAGGRARVPGAVVLAYHDVVDEARPDDVPFTVTAAQLRRQLAWVRAHGVRIVPLVDLVDDLAAGGAGTGTAAVVFDDGLQGVHRHALPVLAELGVPSTVFAVPGALGTRPAWWPGAGAVMARSELAEVVAAGHHVGSHTCTHPSLPHLDGARRREELVAARAALEEMTGVAVETVAYPFGHHDRATRADAADAGYRAGFSFTNGRATAGMDLLRLPRLTMGAHHGRARLAYHLGRGAGAWPGAVADEVLGEAAG